ncbi:MAG: chromate transporter [Pseudorhodobacter sp.]
MDEDNVLMRLVILLVPLSLASIGGGASILAGIERGVVGQYGWFSHEEFLNLFAVSRASPGPGTMLSTLIGWRLEGWTGAIVATLAVYVPSSILCYVVYRTTNLSRERNWYRILRTALAPVGTGLVIAGVINITRISGAGLSGLTMSFAAFFALLMFPRLPLPLMLVLGALISLALFRVSYM